MRSFAIAVCAVLEACTASPVRLGGADPVDGAPSKHQRVLNQPDGSSADSGASHDTRPPDAGAPRDGSTTEPRGSDAALSDGSNSTPHDAAAEVDARASDASVHDAALDQPATPDATLLQDAAFDAVGADAACAPFRIATGAKSPTFIAVDGDGVFWSETGHAGTAADPDVIEQAATDGTSSSTVLTLSGVPGALAVDPGYVYYVESGTPAPSGYAVFRTEKPGKPPSVRGDYAVFSSPAPAPSAIAVEGTELVWADASDVYATTTDAPSGAFTSAGSGLAGVSALALDGTTVWANQRSGTVVGLPLTVGPSPVTVSGSTPSFGVAVDSDRVFWTTEGTVLTRAKSGGATTLVATCATACDAVATDGTVVVWATTHEIWEAPVTGGTPRLLAKGYGDVRHIALDATRVYWTDTSAGSIWSACK